MSRSMKIVDGDLAVKGNNPCEMVEGVDKLIQDLRLWLLEEIGTDRFNPKFGSTLMNEIGRTTGEIERDIMKFKGEIKRVLQNYQMAQAQKMSEERWQPTKEWIPGSGYSMAKEEILDRIGEVETVFQENVLNVRVNLQTHSGMQFFLPLQISLFEMR